MKKEFIELYNELTNKKIMNYWKYGKIQKKKKQKEK